MRSPTLLKSSLIFFLSFPFLCSALPNLSIEPENPIAGEPISLHYVGCEPPFPHVDSGDLFYTEQTDNLIQFVGFFTFSPPICSNPITHTYDLGAFEAGDYELEVYLLLAIETLPVNFDIWTPNEILSFAVSPPPRPVPTMNFMGLGLLILLMLSFAPFVGRKKS